MLLTNGGLRDLHQALGQPASSESELRLRETGRVLVSASLAFVRVRIGWRGVGGKFRLHGKLHGIIQRWFGVGHSGLLLHL